MRIRKIAVAAAFLAVLFAPAAQAQEKLKVVATFSILGDLVQQVGGGRIALTTLVGHDGDAHVYSPTPADAKVVGAASVVFVNGLGFEGWMARLAKSSGTKAPTVTVSAGVKPRKADDDHGHDHRASDPHAWQSVANAKIYVRNIRDALAKADPAGKHEYDANAEAYLAKLDTLENEIRAVIAAIAPERRRIITTHDAFGYFSAAYGVEFISPVGVSTESEISARDVAKIITQIRRQKIPAVFVENITDTRLMEQISRETGARIGGTLYSDALSPPSGGAPNYIEMMRHNVRALSAALAS